MMLSESDSDSDREHIRNNARAALLHFDDGDYGFAARLILDAMVLSNTSYAADRYWYGVIDEIKRNLRLPADARAKLVAAILTGVPQ